MSQAVAVALAISDCQIQKYPVFSISQEDCMKFRPLHDRVVVKRIDAEVKP